mmetsp:Transcript_4851/g.6976  ORF Transcript_4851/g.6976 Transcript_4851/m.6976 type:complete len:88 (+) Transcript_4851:1092-1355(+)
MDVTLHSHYFHSLSLPHSHSPFFLSRIHTYQPFNQTAHSHPPITANFHTKIDLKKQYGTLEPTSEYIASSFFYANSKTILPMDGHLD